MTRELTVSEDLKKYNIENLKDEFLGISSFLERIKKLKKFRPTFIEGISEGQLSKDYIKSKKAHLADLTVKLKRDCITDLMILTGTQKKSLDRGLIKFFKNSYNLDNLSNYSRTWFIFTRKPRKKEIKEIKNTANNSLLTMLLFTKTKENQKKLIKEHLDNETKTNLLKIKNKIKKWEQKQSKILQKKRTYCVETPNENPNISTKRFRINQTNNIKSLEIDITKTENPKHKNHHPDPIFFNLDCYFTNSYYYEEINCFLKSNFQPTLFFLD
ncbi:hypothetical protein M0812_15389 [Anaeramoeba flamelloides]|uniref:Uncharacterized protein n=1 Tax=Anaeramoeba flamelloides TaxID=1746091 RepID=A0AAV7ZCB5_9EUKA|nr:hypothetical protein M0812_15389 [Anaeramoeba flamelloides]